MNRDLLAAEAPPFSIHIVSSLADFQNNSWYCHSCRRYAQLGIDLGILMCEYCDSFSITIGKRQLDCLDVFPSQL